MSTEKLIIILGAIFITISLIIANIMAFNAMEGKILSAMEGKCNTSFQVINNITNITQQIISPSIQQPSPQIVQPTIPIIIPREEAD